MCPSVGGFWWLVCRCVPWALPFGPPAPTLLLTVPGQPRLNDSAGHTSLEIAAQCLRIPLQDPADQK